MHSNNQRLKAAPPALQPPVTLTASASFPPNTVLTFYTHLKTIERVLSMLRWCWAT
ncbi:MAG TPA: hypothetical protein VNZ84_00205 [Methylophilus sp.]|nr:hypothetical protein [Methylophilus sp.]